MLQNEGIWTLALLKGQETRTNIGAVKLGLGFSADGSGDEKVVVAVVLIQRGFRGQLNIVGHGEVGQHDAPWDAVMARTARPRSVAVTFDEGDKAEGRNVRPDHNELPTVAFFQGLQVHALVFSNGSREGDRGLEVTVLSNCSLEMNPGIPIGKVQPDGHGTVGESNRIGRVPFVDFLGSSLSKEFDVVGAT